MSLSTERLSEDQRRYVGRLTAACARPSTGRRIAAAFGQVLRGGRVSARTSWLREAAQSELSAFRDFAAGLRRELASIEAAVREPWGSGQTEGQVNKLKMLERQMYGRVSVPPFRQRLVGAARPRGAAASARAPRRRRDAHPR